MDGIQVDFLGMCDLASVTREGKLNLMGIFGQIFARQLPTRYAKFTLAAIMTSKAEGTMKLRVQIISPSGNDVMPEREVEVKFAKPGKTQLLFDVHNLEIPEAGTYTVKLVSGKDVLKSVPFEVVKVTDQQQGGVN